MPHNRRHFFHVSVVALCLLFAGCAASPQSGAGTTGLACSNSEQRQIQEHLYFGTRTPQGLVSENAWATFVERIITPHFPEGLTVLTGSGQWQGASGNIEREPSYVLSLIYSQDRQKDSAITEIIREYKRRFQQEAVLRVRSEVCVSFP
ncbi:DUF3574 domain-containing protein [Microbulbifer pacificus]|uniref:DUF3574 domain-containing protein n=1 Tax=Microbulbifer pacificus TaxID=407164 RepID=UPI00131A262D|nr:DUF3574 domain-containing protein [Microbulbifer pacificus]